MSESIESMAQHLDQGVERRESTVVQVFLAQFIPKVFGRVHLGTVGRLLDQTDVGRDDQVVRAVPGSPIDLHDDEELRERLADMLQEEIHHGGGSLWGD